MKDDRSHAVKTFFGAMILQKTFNHTQETSPPPPPPSSGPSLRLIRRYQNRKLYDPLQSKYVTLDEISQLLRQGSDLQILDHESQLDVTTTILTQLLLARERKATQPPCLDLLKAVIRHGDGSLSGYLQAQQSAAPKVDPTTTPANLVKSESLLTLN